MTFLDCFVVHFFRLFGWSQKRGSAPRYGLGFRLRPTENSLNIEQNKTMMVHYVKVEFYLSLVKSRHY